MEKIIILSFVLLVCVCIIQGGSPSVSHSPQSPGATPPPSPEPSTPHSPGTTSPAPTTKPETTAAAKPTSGAVTVKAFGGIVFSVLLIALF